MDAVQMMDLKLEHILDAGKYDAERIVLSATKDTDIGKYMMVQGTNTNGETISSDAQRATFWFADQQVNVGDLVVLYTKEGKEATKDLEGGKKSYFYYWGLKQPLWVPGFTAVLIQISSWSFEKRFDAKPLAAKSK